MRVTLNTNGKQLPHDILQELFHEVFAASEAYEAEADTALQSMICARINAVARNHGTVSYSDIDAPGVDISVIFSGKVAA